MKNPIRTLAVWLVIALAVVPAFTLAAARGFDAGSALSQQAIGALERGYRTGYSDGYQSGYSDSVARAARDYKNKDEYQRADRAYATSYGTLEDYRDGYQQGFEAGYDVGYERRVFDSTIPANLSRRGTTDSSNDGNTVLTNPGTSSSTSGNSNSSSTSGTINPSDVTFIPADAVLRIELLTNLSTDSTQRNDRFQARVIEPAEYRDAMIEGHVSRVKRPGKIKGTAELQLTFDKISINNRWADFKAQVIEVVDNGTSEGVGDVDEEGGVKGKDKTKDDVAKIGASTGVGAIIGAIFGGGKGAAIGAAIGGAIGTGGVLTSRGKDIRLDHGQHLRIRTSSETRF